MSHDLYELRCRVSPAKVEKWHGFFRMVMSGDKGMFHPGQLVGEYSPFASHYMKCHRRWFPHDYLLLMPILHWRYLDGDGMPRGWSVRKTSYSVQASYLAWNIRQEIGDQVMTDLQIPHIPIGEFHGQ